MFEHTYKYREREREREREEERKSVRDAMLLYAMLCHAMSPFAVKVHIGALYYAVLAKSPLAGP